MSLAEDLAKIPQIARGEVWCTVCSNHRKLNGVNHCIVIGWPKCCGLTMTIDSPEERAKLKIKPHRGDRDE